MLSTRTMPLAFLQVSLSNEIDTVDFRGKRPAKKLANIAACLSAACTGKQANDAFSKGKIKNVNLQTIYCPDCGHALVWRKKAVTNGEEKAS